MTPNEWRLLEEGLRGLPYRDLLLSSIHQADCMSWNRRAGKTIAIALQIISIAMLYPGQPIPIRDHHRNHVADMNLAKTVGLLIEKIGLQGLGVYRRGGAFRVEYKLEEVLHDR